MDRNVPDKLYKFKSLNSEFDLGRIKDIIKKGFWCSKFLEFNDMNEGVYIGNHIPFNEKENYKICSFSARKALYSELVWGHYANGGKGVAIEIQVDNEKKYDIYTVTYTDNFQENLNIKKILTTKSTSWKYEDEYRLLTTKQGNEHSIGKITKIYIGTPYKSLQNYEKDIKIKLCSFINNVEKLKEFCKENYPQIEIEYFDFNNVGGKNEKS